VTSQAATLERYRDPSDLKTLDSFLEEERADHGIPIAATSRGHLITTPITVHCRADIASLLRAHRMALGWTCEETDARAGFSDRYVTKLEHGDSPTGKRGFHITGPTATNPGGDVRASFMASVWLETMGLELVLMPASVARSIGSVPAPGKAAPCL